MSYLNRGFVIIPLLAAAAWAQEPAPAPAAQVPAGPEAALRARAQNFFQLQVDKKYRPAEAMVAEDTKDLYYNGRKFNINGFTIDKVELLDNNTRAKVSINAKVRRAMPGYGFVDFNAPTVTLWKLEGGEWQYYIDQSAELQTPFGTLKEGKTGGSASPGGLQGKIADLSSMQNLVKIDHEAVALAGGGPEQVVMVSNALPGGVDLSIEPYKIAGVSAELDKKHLESGEKTAIRLRTTSQTKAVGLIRLSVAPIGTELSIRLLLN